MFGPWSAYLGTTLVHPLGGRQNVNGFLDREARSEFLDASGLDQVCHDVVEQTEKMSGEATTPQEKNGREEGRQRTVPYALPKCNHEIGDRN